MQDKTVKQFISETLTGFLYMLYPPGTVCSFCGGEQDGGACINPATEPPEVCGRCIAALSFIKSSCGICGCSSKSSVCIRCKGHSFDFERTISVSDYDSFAINLLFKLKNGGRYIASDMAALMADKYITEGISADLVTFVPITPKVFKKRGYNQSLLLARHISLLCGLQFADTLIKTRDTARQKTLSAPERLKNIKDAYGCACPEIVKGKTVLLADDVITTGITLSECARSLVKAGARKVYGITFAAVKHSVYMD